jgi:CheY-like chemotaxis protein
MARLIIVEDNSELAALIASAAQARGHAPVAVHSGQAALQAIAGATFDVAVVDLLLPDIRGGEILDRLRERRIPAIAVSGVYRGERFAREATEQHGARKFFEKPFDMRALLLEIEGILGAPLEAELIEDDGDDEDDLDALEELLPIDDEDDEPLILPDRPRPTPAPLPAAPAAASPAPAPLPPPVPDELLPPPVMDLDEVPTRPGFVPALSDEEPTKPMEIAAVAAAAAAAAEVPFETRAGVWGREKTAPRSERRRPFPEWTQAGDLSRSSVPRLLNACYQARHTGELKLKQGQVLKVVFFEDGQPVYAASNLAAERFGRFCVRHGVLSEADLKRVSALAESEKLRTGEAMIRLGLLSADRRKELLEEQIREIIWSTFGWTQGEYAFAPRTPKRPDMVKLKVFPGEIILQGVLRTQALLALRQKMPPARRLFPTFDPPYAPHDLSLSPPQAMLVAAADGTKTVEDLLALTDLSERETLAALLGFELLGLLVERRDENKRQRISFGL